jgi:PAS domain S-box-containing protein
MVSRRTTRGAETPRLTDFIHENRQEILATWELAVRALPVVKTLERPALMDQVPDLLERIAQSADELATGGVAQPPITFAQLRALNKLGEGFDLAQVITELTILRDIITRMWDQPLRDVGHRRDLHILNDAMDKAISSAARRFQEARDRTLQALDRISAVLRDSETRFQTLADNVPEVVWMADANGKVFWYNARWTQLTGITFADEGGAGWQRALHPDYMSRVSIRIHRAITTGEMWEDMFPLRRLDGQYRWVLFRAMPIRDDTGKVVRWLGTGTDVTNVRFLDEATRVLSSSLDYNATLERLARLVVPELADFCVVDLVETEGEVRRVAVAHNDPATDAWAHAWIREHPPDPKASRGIFHVIRSGEADFLREVTPDVLKDNQNLRALYDLGLKSAIIVPLSARGRTIGAITLLMMDSKRIYESADVEFAKELGRRAGLAVDNARLYQAAQRAVRLREDVLAIVSHDLRNPLGAIDLSASMLLQTVGNEARARNQLEVIRRSVGRMEHMINDLLDMASIQAGRLSLKRELEDAKSLINEVLDVHEPIAQGKSIRLGREISIENEKIESDRDRIAQVFGNILGNALKFCRPGDAITVRAYRTDHEVRFEIQDTGPGIAEEDLPHIFEPYWSVKRAQPKGTKSTGLGLHICKAIIEAHGGRLWAASKLGHGATFTVALPIAEEHRPD